MPEIPAENSPWGELEWRERALAWVHEQIRRQGATVLAVDEPRLRAWSVILRLRTSLGPLWFKANPPGSRFEAGLAGALSQWVPGSVLTPLAIDAAQGWSLFPDGGQIMHKALDAEPALSAWEELLRQYAGLQRAIAPHVEEMLRIGVPDLRANLLPARFAELVDSELLRAQIGVPGGITPAQYAALASAGPALLAWCAQLGASSVPPTLDHSDLHEGQVFVAQDGRFVFFDWGDAGIAHPFASLLVAYRVAAKRFGLAPADLDRLRDAYLEPWTAEHPVAELRAQAELAVRLAAITRALSWGRIFPQAAQLLGGDHGRSVAHWLLRVLAPELIEPEGGNIGVPQAH